MSAFIQTGTASGHHVVIGSTYFVFDLGALYRWLVLDHFHKWLAPSAVCRWLVKFWMTCKHSWIYMLHYSVYFQVLLASSRSIARAYKNIVGSFRQPHEGYMYSINRL